MSQVNNLLKDDPFRKTYRWNRRSKQVTELKYSFFRSRMPNKEEYQLEDSNVKGGDTATASPNVVTDLMNGDDVNNHKLLSVHTNLLSVRPTSTATAKTGVSRSSESLSPNSVVPDNTDNNKEEEVVVNDDGSQFSVSLRAQDSKVFDLDTSSLVHAVRPQSANTNIAVRRKRLKEMKLKSMLNDLSVASEGHIREHSSRQFHDSPLSSTTMKHSESQNRLIQDQMKMIEDLSNQMEQLSSQNELREVPNEVNVSDKFKDRKKGKVIQPRLKLRPSDIDPETLKRLEILKTEGKDVLFLNTGKLSVSGQPPITYYRQVMALWDLPPEHGVDHEHAQQMFPTDVIARAKEYNVLKKQGMMWTYTEPQGILTFRQDISSFIEARDGYPSNEEDIFITDGASMGLEMVLSALISSENDAIMTPEYYDPLYQNFISSMGGKQVYYYFNKDEGWTITKESLEFSYDIAVSRGLTIKALSIINPGDPLGYCLDRSSLKTICEFCVSRGIKLLADEVYQEICYNGKEFISVKKVCRESPKCEFQLELISFHSVKGMMSECERQGGYLELCNISPSFRHKLIKLVGETLPFPSVSGQIMTSLLTKPPLPTDESYIQFQNEKSQILESLANRMAMVVGGLNSINGMKCHAVDGSLYAFPSVELPRDSILAAAAAGMSPDSFYCLSLLEKTCILVVPASHFGGNPDLNCFGFRISCLIPDEKVTDVIHIIRIHHEEFCNFYS